MYDTDKWGRKQYIVAVIGLIIAFVALIFTIYGTLTSSGQSGTAIDSEEGHVIIEGGNGSDTIINDAGRSKTVINGGEGADTIINGEGVVADHFQLIANITTDTPSVNKDLDGQLSKLTPSEVIFPGNIFRGNCINNGKISDIELQITDANSEISDFRGNLRWLLKGESHKIIGHVEPGSNKVCFNEYLNGTEPLADQSIIGEYSLEITSNGLSGNVTWLRNEGGKGTVSLYTWEDYSDYN